MLRFPRTSAVAMAMAPSMLFCQSPFWKEQTCFIKPDRMTNREVAGLMSGSDKLYLLWRRVIMYSGYNLTSGHNNWALSGCMTPTHRPFKLGCYTIKYDIPSAAAFGMKNIWPH